MLRDDGEPLNLKIGVSETSEQKRILSKLHKNNTKQLDCA